MGRHSAPDDAPDDALDDEPEGALAVATDDVTELGAVATFERGRHARDDDDDARSGERLATAVVAGRGVATDDTVRIGAIRDDSAAAPTAQIDPVAPETPAGNAQPAPAAPAKAADRSSGGGSAADFRLVREHADVRARCLAAVLVPFAAYLVVFAALGRLGVSALMWIWIPLITAGVLLGVFLDAGHKRYGTDSSAVRRPQQPN